MSWFKRKPRIKEPQRHIVHHRRSPITEQMLEEAKKSGPNYEDKKIEKIKNK